MKKKTILSECELRRLIKETVKERLNEQDDICVTPYYDDAIEAIEMTDGCIDFYEWYDAFRDELDLEKGEEIFNSAMKTYNLHESVKKRFIQLIEANHKSPRKYTLTQDQAFFDELYRQAKEEAERNYNDYLEENWESLQRHLRWGSIDHIPTFEEWMHKYGPGDNYIRGIIKKYKENLVDVDKDHDVFDSDEINLESRLHEDIDGLSAPDEKKFIVYVDNERKEYPATQEGEKAAFKDALYADNGLHNVRITDQDGTRMQPGYLNGRIEYIDYRDKGTRFLV